AAELLAHRPLDPTGSRSVAEVYERLLALAKAQGPGSQEVKVQTLLELLEHATPLEGKYLVRFVLGQLRLGVREMTLLDALAVAFGTGEKADRARIEAAFNVTSDLGRVASVLAERGLDGLRDLHLEVGRPIRPMLAERASDLADLMERMDGRAALEFKYDGLRVQAHIGADGSVRLFSRRLEETGAQFPELVRELPKAIVRPPAIVEGECVPIDPDTDEIRPFQEVSRRRGRKYDLERMESEVPVALFLFDVLLSGGVPIAELPFPERRSHLESLVRPSERIRLAEQVVVGSVPEAQAYFDGAIAAGGEGIVAKSLAPESSYRAGARGFWWIKYKREYTHALADSIDGVVVGAFHGRGRRAGRYGALLMAVYDPAQDRFESFCKVGSGFDDETLDALPKRLGPDEVAERPAGVESGIVPDRWIRPRLVLEVRGAELSLSPIHRAGAGLLSSGAGLALRFPRFTGRFRDDKSPTQATTSAELLALFKTQVKRSTAAPADA
ncbi:MAG TPA: ATP-dependent DNA ligase, partial [Thermoplasmata archaeon]|nr:ATP-dependent DNA ligase [Thermoplasmata archaeon]